MEYGIRELSEMAGISSRTLRYYDEIGLLLPSHTNEAGYRFYGEKEVELLQQILFYRERGFGLEQIRNIVYQTNFDVLSALYEHLIEIKGSSHCRGKRGKFRREEDCSTSQGVAGNDLERLFSKRA